MSSNKCSAKKQAKCLTKQKVCNPETGRCINVGGSVYKKVFPHGHSHELLSIQQLKKKQAREIAHARALEEIAHARALLRDVDTAKTKVDKKKCSAKKQAKCRTKQKVCNPETGRCIKVGGSAYKKAFPHGHTNVDDYTPSIISWDLKGSVVPITTPSRPSKRVTKSKRLKKTEAFKREDAPEKLDDIWWGYADREQFAARPAKRVAKSKRLKKTNSSKRKKYVDDLILYL